MEVGEGGCPTSSASTGLSRLQNLEVVPIIWLQMTFASIYLLHFDFAFNFRATHGVCAAWGM